MSKRGKWRIYLDILRVVSRNGSCSKTRAMQLSNLSWRSFENRFRRLLDGGFLKNNGDEVKNYSLTEKGEELFLRLLSVEEMLEDGP